ncbi:hypothetical protein GJ744_002538 [Endocarpon pusillum]|uniref:Fungal N-terminal domain-containing protein n=1 Tax=Endocarpon pusillum TaxID=364733 RepID=A0A8H7E0F1_9EURO|nr:hypothetical protein GJ744_002538 [Endocarpon pusillum]
MAGIGEATAIIALAETGFSLARAINTYISDVSDAKDDILSLSSEIDSTFRNLRDLAEFINMNETTKVWSDDGIENARKCVRDSELVITKMRKLLKKATASDMSPKVERDEIDITKFQKAKWPILKPELEVRRRELQIIKQDIILAYTSYNAKAAPTPADRQQAVDDLPRLERIRKLMKRQVVDAKRQRHDQRSKVPGPNRHPQSKDRHGGSYNQRGYSGSSNSDDENVEDVLNEFIYNNIEDLKMDFEDWAREKEEKQKKAEEETKRIQVKAVEDWKKEQMEEAERRRHEVEGNREKLKLELSRPELRLAPSQIEEALNNVYPRPRPGNELALMPSGNQGPSSDADAESVQTSSSRKPRSWSVWSRSSRAGRPKNTNTDTNGRHRFEIPELLQDPLAAGGVAELKAFYLQRAFTLQGPIISTLNVEIPAQWLLHALIAKEEKYLQDPKVNSLWKEFAQIPEDYRYAIDNHITSWRQSFRNNEPWVLIYVESLKLEKSSSRLSRRAQKEVTGVYIVLKKESGSKQAPMIAAADQAAEDDDHVSQMLRQPHDMVARTRKRDAESDSIESESDTYTLIPRRASVVRPEYNSRSKSRSGSHGRDHSHIAKRASESISRSRYDDRYYDTTEERRRYSGRTRTGSGRRDSTPFNRTYDNDDEEYEIIEPRYPTPPLPSHRRSSPYYTQHARFSRQPPIIINSTVEPLSRRPPIIVHSGLEPVYGPPRRGTVDSWNGPSRRGTADSMDSMDSRSGPNTGYHYRHHPRHQVSSRYDQNWPAPTRLSDIQELIDDESHRSYGDSDMATHSAVSSSSDSELGDKLRDLSAAEKGESIPGETAKTDEEISREILARLTTGTTATATEDAEGKPEREGQGQGRGEESAVPAVSTVRSPSSRWLFGVELSEEPAGQDQGADAETGGGATDK